MEAGYFSTSWSDIKNSPGWLGKICLLGLLSFIPVFGSMVFYGYSYAWARDIAWDIHQPMPERIFGNEDGKLYSRGISIWLVFLVASFVAGLVGVLLGSSVFSSLAVLALTLFLGMFAAVGAMRIAIYGRLSAGFQVKKMWSMMAHDTNGLLRILGMVVLTTLIVGFVFGIVLVILIMMFAFAGIAGVGMGTDWSALEYSLIYGGSNSYDQLASLFAILAPVFGIGMIFFALLVYAISCFGVWINLLQARAMGYWVRQFDVAHWGGQDDPMPFETNGQTNVSSASSVDQPVQVVEPASSQVAGSAVDPSSHAANAATETKSQPVRMTVVCPSCGRTVDGENARFCVQCGAQLVVDDDSGTPNNA